MFWCRLASKIGMPVFQAKQTLPMSEVRLWRAYFDDEWSRHEKIEWYLAQIVAVIHNSNYKTKMKVKDGLLIFTSSKAKKKADSMSGILWARTWFGQIAKAQQMGAKSWKPKGRKSKE